MIKTLLTVFILLALPFFGKCEALDDKSYDKVLVGMWSGNAQSDEGYYKNWIHKKKLDGSYQTSFFYYENGLYQHFEKVSGTWWVSKGVLYQSEPWMIKPAMYKYTTMANGCIEYNLIAIVSDADVSAGYSFRECPFKE